MFFDFPLFDRALFSTQNMNEYLEAHMLFPTVK